MHLCAPLRTLPYTPLHVSVHFHAPLCAPLHTFAHPSVHLCTPLRTPLCTSAHLRAPICTPPRTSVHLCAPLCAPLSRIESGAFSGLGKLKRLLLWNNVLIELDSSTFQGLSALTDWLWVRIQSRVLVKKLSLSWKIFQNWTLVQTESRFSLLECLKV